MNDELWERHADWWQREFTDGADPEYVEQLLPLAAALAAGAERVLDLGTGEGQMARMLQADGAQVVGIDVAASQIDEAVRRGGGVTYLRSSVAGLPFAAASFDLAIACLVFEHIDDLDESLAEVARVVEPGGRFVLFLNHPLLQTPGSGWIDDHMVDPPEQYWRIGPYLVETATIEQVQKGVFIRFVHRPLSRYVNGLADVGLRLMRMVEPAPPDGFLAKAPEYVDASTVPRLLVLVAERARDES
ncbi:MAG: class I SAM-dependent methyltransferase [Acidimicrobiia bacterium]|nr:class I SAM-dependent methyltransferase [Acidimicrobiia bacterium]